MEHLFSGDGTSAVFATTHWSAVTEARSAEGSRAAAALEQICRVYWYPLYAYVRRRGHTPEQAEDLTQAFFARLLEQGYLLHANRERGKFRTFLLTGLQHFIVNEWKKHQAGKRGGGKFLVPWPEEQTEARYLAEAAELETPEKLFEKRWALALLEQVLARLETEFSEAGKQAQFQELKNLLWGEKPSLPYAEVAAKLAMTEGALKVAVHRLRQRYRELLRAEVARTVVSPTEVDEELRHLLALFSS